MSGPHIVLSNTACRLDPHFDHNSPFPWVNPSHRICHHPPHPPRSIRINLLYPSVFHFHPHGKLNLKMADGFRIQLSAMEPPLPTLPHTNSQVHRYSHVTRMNLIRVAVQITHWANRAIVLLAPPRRRLPSSFYLLYTKVQPTHVSHI